MDGSVRILALLEEGYEKTGESGAGAIQGVAEVVSSLGVFVAKFHAAGLVVAKARAAGDFKIFALGREPHTSMSYVLQELKPTSPVQSSMT